MGVNAVLVTAYDEFPDITVSEDHLASVSDVFKSFGIGEDFDNVALRGRVDKQEIEAAMKLWQHSAAGTVIYWLGHGVGPAPGRLLHSASAKNRTYDGVLPVNLVDDLFRLGTETRLIVLILEACRSDAFVLALTNELRERQHRCATLVLFSDESVTTPGAVVRVLREVVDDVFGAQDEIHLAKIGAEFEIRSVSSEVAFASLNLGDAILTRSAQLPTSQTLDVHRRLRKAVEALPADERDHFVAKAQSGGSGELTWNFEGREAERQEVRRWLDSPESSICIVRGDAGQGKSAFLGDIVTRSRPELFEALVRAGLMTRVNSWPDTDGSMLVVSINASGISTRRLLERFSEGLDEPSLVEGLELDEGLNRIAAHIDSVDGAVLFIVDGLDEMQEPIEGARFIGAASARFGSKILVACRDAPNEGRHYLSYAHPDLVQAIVEAAPAGQAVEIPLQADAGAIDRYIRKRLKAVRSGLVIPDHVDLRATDFLHASLIVHEIAAEPDLLDAGLLADLLHLNLVQLFELMLDRLRRRNPVFIPIFQACAISQGRGIPMADDVWLTVARTVAGTAEGCDPNALADFLVDAESYLRIDNEYEQTVYRPAHSLLRDFLLLTLPCVSRYHTSLAGVCAAHVREAAPGASNAYYQHAATMHAAQSDRAGWWEIDRVKPAVWRLLDPRRVVEDAMSDLFGWATMPGGVEDLVLSHHVNMGRGNASTVEGWSQAVRTGRYIEPRLPTGDRPSGNARLHWAHNIARQPLSLSLTGHRGRVTAIREARLGPDQSGLLVGTAHGGVYLWNLESGGLVAEFEGLHRAALCVCSVVDAELGLVVLGGDSTGQIIAWSARTQHVLWQEAYDTQIAARITETGRSSTTSMAALVVRKEVSAVVVVTDHRVRIVNVKNGRTLYPPQTALRRFGPAVAIGEDRDGIRSIVIGAADEPGLFVWQLHSIGDVLTLNMHRDVELPADLVAIRLMQSPENTFRLLLANGQLLRWKSGSHADVELHAQNGTISMGDLSASPTGLTDIHVDQHLGLLEIRLVTDDRQQRLIGASHGAAPSTLRVIDRPGGRAIAVSGGSDRTVRIWDPYSVGTRKPSAEPQARTVLAVQSGGGRTLGVVSGQDGTIQFVNGANARSIERYSLGSTVVSLSSSTDKPGHALIAAGTLSGQMHLWRQRGLDRPERLPFNEQFPDGVVMDVEASGELVAAATSGGNLALWRQAHRLELLVETTFEPSEITNVKVLRPFDDLAVIVVVTPSLVRSFSISMERRPRRLHAHEVPHGINRIVSSLYSNGRGIGVVYGGTDGLVRVLPSLWTPKHSLVIDKRASRTLLNLRQPVSSINARLVQPHRLVVVVGGAHGRLMEGGDTRVGPPLELEFGQIISSVSAQKSGVLAAVQGGVMSVSFGRDSLS